MLFVLFDGVSYCCFYCKLPCDALACETVYKCINEMQSETAGTILELFIQKKKTLPGDQEIHLLVKWNNPWFAAYVN